MGIFAPRPLQTAYGISSGRPFQPHPLHRIKHAIRRIHAVEIFGHFGAEEAARHWMRRVSLNLGGSAVLHRDQHSAGVRTIVGAGGVNDFLHAPDYTGQARPVSEENRGAGPPLVLRTKVNRGCPTLVFAPERKGCLGTLCKGRHETEHPKPGREPRAPGIFVGCRGASCPRRLERDTSATSAHLPHHAKARKRRGLLRLWLCLGGLCRCKDLPEQRDTTTAADETPDKCLEDLTGSLKVHWLQGQTDYQRKEEVS